MTLAAPAPIAFPPLSRTDLVRYAGASGDFNPLHHDHAFATAAGLPDVMAHGMLSAGLLASAVTAWFGEGSVLRFAVRFRSPVWPGDRLVAGCESLTMRESDGGCIADLALALKRGDGEIVLTGKARVKVVA
jgi:acyl dehydratase